MKANNLVFFKFKYEDLLMDDRLTGSILIILGLLIAGLGGTMSNVLLAVFYIVGFLMAFVGLGFLLKYRRASLQQD